MQTAIKIKANELRPGDVVRMKNGHLAPVHEVTCGINGNCKIIFERPSVIVLESHELEVYRVE